MKDLRANERNKDHFGTDHLRLDLKSRTVSSGLVTAAAQGAQLVLNVGATMVLARLLLPRDFGLVAMVMTVMAFLRIFKEAGLSTATVQREAVNHAQVSNLFWTNIALSTFASVAMAASAPLIAWFYGEPTLTRITLILAGTFLLNGLTAQHFALLSRQMRFKAIATIQVASTAAGVFAGLGMAWAQCGYWSLVGFQLSMASTMCLLTWRVSRWRPQWISRDADMRSLLTFGVNVTTSAFIYSLARGADSLLIGKYYGSDSLGLYSRASALLIRPVEQLTSPLNDVLVPALSRLQADPRRYHRTFLQTHDAIALVACLFTGVFFPLARPLILVMLGAQWEHGAVIFGALTVGALFTPLCSAASWLLASQARGRDWLVMSVVVSLVTVASFVVGLPFGPNGVAISYAVSGVLVVLPVVYYMAGRQGPVSTADLWASLSRHLPLCAVVLAVTAAARVTVLDFGPLAQLSICAFTGSLAGVAFAWFFTPIRRTAVNLVATIRDIKKVTR